MNPSPSTPDLAADDVLPRRMLLILLGLSLLLAALKFHAGWVSESLVLMSDGINMLVVGAAVVAFWVGGGDAEPTEAQERARIWSVLITGLFLILCVWEIYGIAFENIWFRTGAPAFNWYAVSTAAGTTLIAFGLRRVPVWTDATCGTLTFSGVSSLLTLLALLAAQLENRWIDPVSAGVVALLTFFGVRNLILAAIFTDEE